VVAVTDVASGRAGDVSWAAAGRAVPGESESGDRFVVRDHGDGVLLGVVDGLGHGPEAAEAAVQAIEAIEERAGAPLEEIFQHCHTRLQGTRGAVISLVHLGLSTREMSWGGVGDVDVVIVRRASERTKHERIHLVGGVVGYHLPPLAIGLRQLESGDTVALATDGLRPGFASEIRSMLPPETIALRTLERHARDSDDALVLVARGAGRAA
jgi:negative regulator of sigma-B (phosphoserine phosphatase)